MNLKEADAKILTMQERIFSKMGRPANRFESEQESSRTVREDGITYVNDLKYADEFPNSFLDIWYSEQENLSSLPTIVYFHGGGYFFGDKVNGDPLAKSEEGQLTDFFVSLVKQGYNLVSVDYAYAPEYRFPTQIQQANQAITYLSRNAKELGINMRQVILMGSSAGATICEIFATLMVNEKYQNSLGVSPTIDKEVIKVLVIDEASLNTTNFDDGMNTMYYSWIGIDNLDSGDLIELLDIPKWLKNNYYPSYLISSNEEPYFKDSALALVGALKQIGVANQHYYVDKEVELLEHGFMQRFRSNPYARECYESMLNFLEEFITVNQ